MHVMPAILSVFAMTMPAVAHAQAGQWEVVAQPGRSLVAKVAAQGSAHAIALTCNGSTPVIGINLQQPPTRNPARVTISVDGKPFQLAFARNPGTTVWFTSLQDQRLLDLMAGGSSAQISIEDANYATASMAGSQAAFKKALAGCYRAPVRLTSTPKAPGSTPTSLPPAARAAWENLSRARCRFANDRFVARSFTPSPYSEANPGAPDDNFIAGDLNGDGLPDFALVTNDQGCSQHDYVFFTDFVVSGSSGYRAFEGFGGKQSVESARRCGDRDVIILDSGAVWGWKNGRVDHLGTQDRCATLAQTSVGAGGRRLAAGAAGSGRGALAKIPMQLGYYVPAGETCRRPSSLMKFEADGYWMIDNEGAFKEMIASVSSEQGAYVLQFANVPSSSSDDLVEPVSEIIVTPQGRGRILVQINGDGYMNFCNESDIPQKFKK